MTSLPVFRLILQLARVAAQHSPLYGCVLPYVGLWQAIFCNCDMQFPFADTRLMPCVLCI